MAEQVSGLIKTKPALFSPRDLGFGSIKRETEAY